MTPSTISVSPSLLADVIACSTKGWARHVKGYTSKGDAIKAVAGQAFHAAVAEFLAPGDSCSSERLRNGALEEFHRIYDPAWARLSADLLEPALIPSNLHRVLDRWLEMHPPTKLPWRRVLHVEEAFVSRTFIVETSLWTSDVLVPPKKRTAVRLIVRPDLVVEDHAGMIRFVDTKTTGWHIGDTGWQRNLRLSLQLALYTDAVQQKYGERAVLGGWINAVELRKLPGSEDTGPVKLKKDGTPAAPRKCADHHVPYVECGNEHAKMDMLECMTTPERLAQAVKDAEAGAATFVRLLGIEDAAGAMLEMNGTAKGECRFCPAADWCEAGRTNASMDSFMVFEPWVVDEGVRA